MNAAINESLDHSITDHWCIKVTLKPLQIAQRPRALEQLNTNYKSGDHTTLKQGTIRGLINLEQTVQSMMGSKEIISCPAYEYIDKQLIDEAVEKEQ